MNVEQRENTKFYKTWKSRWIHYSISRMKEECPIRHTKYVYLIIDETFIQEVGS